jgi:hypothetical protein
MRLLPLIRQALKAQGVLLIQTPNGEGLCSRQVIYGDLTHMTVLSPGSLRQLLTLTGFDNIRFMETGPVPKNLLGVLRVLGWKGVKACANTIRLIEAGKTQAIWTENMICASTKAAA